MTQINILICIIEFKPKSKQMPYMEFYSSLNMFFLLFFILFFSLLNMDFATGNHRERKKFMLVCLFVKAYIKLQVD